MGRQSGRNVGAGLMLGAALLLTVGIFVADSAVRAVDRQAAELDPSRSRFEQAGSMGAIGGVVAAIGMVVFLVALLILAIGTWRANKRGGLVRQPSAGVAWSATGLLIAALLYAFVLPQGPLALAIGLGTGGGGSAGATQVAAFNGTLTGAGLVPGQSEDIHPFHPPASDGAIRIRFGSGGAAPNAFAVATLEAQDGAAWRVVAEARGANATVDVVRAHYAGELRIRVHLDQGAVGRVDYVAAISFAPRG